MFDAEGHIVIANFSSADFVPSTEISRSNQDWPHSLRPEYRAPEVLLGWAHNAAADCWSFGMLFYFMLFGTVFIYASFRLMMLIDLRIASLWSRRSQRCLILTSE